MAGPTRQHAHKKQQERVTLLCSSNIQTGTVGAFAAYLFVYRRYLERQDPDNGLGTTKDLSFHAGVDRDSNLPLFTKSFADGFVLLDAAKEEPEPERAWCCCCWRYVEEKREILQRWKEFTPVIGALNRALISRAVEEEKKSNRRIPLHRASTFGFHGTNWKDL